MQFSEFQITWMLWKMAPRLLWNRVRHGRALDVLVTHSPPRDLGDREDLPHRGFKAIRSLLARWRPKYMVHGHVHLYDRSHPFIVPFEQTTIINVYPFRVLDLDLATAIDDQFPHGADVHHPPMANGLNPPRAVAERREPAHG
jgi:Icc-related predicted phosphoesterase